MIGRIQYVLAVGALMGSAMVSAIPWPGAKETDGGNAVVGWSPIPTSPPLLYRAMDLFQRQTSESRGDNTCGYEHSNPSNTYSCNDPDYVCATNSAAGVHGCCDPNSLAACSITTTCYASTDMSSCTGDCLSDGYAARCTLGSVTECYNILYNFNTTTMTEWGCTDVATTVSVDFSTSGEELGTDTSQAVVPISTRIITVTPSESGSTESSTVDPATIPGAASGGNGSLRTPTRKGKSNVGAIAGGVVGGIVGLALIVGAVFFFLMRRKKSKNADASAAAASFPGATAPGYQPPPMQENAQYPHGQYPQGQYPQNQYPQGAYSQGAYAQTQQTHNGYYDVKNPATQEYKYNYTTPMTQPPPAAAGAVELGSEHGPNGPTSTAPTNVQQLDSTTVGTSTTAGQGQGQAPAPKQVHELGS